MDKSLKRNQFLRQGSDLTQSERQTMVLEYLEGNQSKASIWKKYTGQDTEHGKILLWLRQFGYEDKPKLSNFASNTPLMSSSKQRPLKTESIDFEKQQLKNRIAQLEQQLAESEMKAIAYSTMVDVAEEKFQIPIRKKYTTKP